MKRVLLILVLLVGCVCIVFGVLAVIGRNSDSSSGTSVLRCAKVTITSCDIDTYSSVFGTVENTCSGTTIHQLEVVAEVYDESGMLLATDPEYVENLGPGDQATFEALMDRPAAAGKTCRVRVTRGY